MRAGCIAAIILLAALAGCAKNPAEAQEAAATQTLMPAVTATLAEMAPAREGQSLEPDPTESPGLPPCAAALLAARDLCAAGDVAGARQAVLTSGAEMPAGDDASPLVIKGETGPAIALYPGGYVYVGDMEDGVQSGYGWWFSLDSSWWYEGEWAWGDPHGEGTLHLPELDRVHSGPYYDGWEHGDRRVVDGAGNVFVYKASFGVIPTILTDHEAPQGERLVVAMSRTGGRLRKDSPKSIWGVEPWCLLDETDD